MEMKFTEESKPVIDCLFLIEKGRMELKDVPSILNLRELVENALNIKLD